ncbi:MAG TPA: hypothetical protein VF601_21815 [Beijerinckiaceae bacterium]|jgi:hypothetical protein
MRNILDKAGTSHRDDAARKLLERKRNFRKARRRNILDNTNTSRRGGAGTQVVEPKEEF